jgi:hypothetical protein
MATELHIVFILSGFDCSPSEISSVLGIEPDKSWNAGDLIVPIRRPRKTNGWMVDVRSHETEELEPLIVQVLDRLPPSLEGLSRVAGTWTAKIYAAIYFTERPTLTLGADTVRRIAGLGAILDIDLFPMHED